MARAGKVGHGASEQVGNLIGCELAEGGCERTGLQAALVPNRRRARSCLGSILSSRKSLEPYRPRATIPRLGAARTCSVSEEPVGMATATVPKPL
jgi:hypothetical protein